MTTIVYKDGVLAADSLVTDRGCRMGSAKKIISSRFGLAGAVGHLGLMQAFLNWAATGRPADGRPVPDKTDDNDFEGLIITPAGQVLWYGGDMVAVDMTQSEYVCLGSGFRVAMGALEMGATAEQAVRVAAKVDTSTGGPIHVLELKTD